MLVVFETYALTTMTFRGVDGTTKTEGFALGDRAELINAIGVTRDASGLFAAADMTFDDGREFIIRDVERLGGFWVPMGWERKGPAFSAYDGFIALRDGAGQNGAGIVEQGILRLGY